MILLIKTTTKEKFSIKCFEIIPDFKKIALATAYSMTKREGNLKFKINGGRMPPSQLMALSDAG